MVEWMGYNVDRESRSMGVCYGLLRIVMMAAVNYEDREHPGDQVGCSIPEFPIKVVVP